MKFKTDTWKTPENIENSYVNYATSVAPLSFVGALTLIIFDLKIVAIIILFSITFISFLIFLSHKKHNKEKELKEAN